MNNGLLFGDQLHVIRNLEKKKLEILTSDLLNIYDISGPKLGQVLIPGKDTLKVN